jgi:hypothetical protein
MKHFIQFLCFAAVLSPLPAVASTVTYIYTGNGFTSFSGSPGVNGSNYIQVTLVYNSVLPGGLSYAVETAGLQSWSVTDGVHTLSNTTPGTVGIGVNVSTDAQGNIIGEWAVNASKTSITGTDLQTMGLNTENCSSHCGNVVDQYTFNDSGSGFPPIPPSSASASATANAAGWTTIGAPTPEPATAWLLLAGPVLFIVRRRR